MKHLRVTYVTLVPCERNSMLRHGVDAMGTHVTGVWSRCGTHQMIGRQQLYDITWSACAHKRVPALEVISFNIWFWRRCTGMPEAWHRDTAPHSLLRNWSYIRNPNIFPFEGTWRCVMGMLILAMPCWGNACYNWAVNCAQWARHNNFTVKPGVEHQHHWAHPMRLIQWPHSL